MATVSVRFREKVCVSWACILWIFGYWSVLLDYLTPFSTVSQLAYSHQPAPPPPPLPPLSTPQCWLNFSVEVTQCWDPPWLTRTVYFGQSLYFFFFRLSCTLILQQRTRKKFLAQPHHSFSLWAQRKGRQVSEKINKLQKWPWISFFPLHPNVLNVACFLVCSMLRQENKAFYLQCVAGDTSCALNPLIFLFRWITFIEGIARMLLLPMGQWELLGFTEGNIGLTCQDNGGLSWQCILP